jgi:hypothetical protein
MSGVPRTPSVTTASGDFRPPDVAGILRPRICAKIFKAFMKPAQASCSNAGRSVTASSIAAHAAPSACWLGWLAREAARIGVSGSGAVRSERIGDGFHPVTAFAPFRQPPLA